MNKKIAITGGIGSGKSTALAILNELGYKTLSSDGIVTELYKTHKVKRLIKKLFPTAVKGLFSLKIDRAELAKQAFSSPELHKRLTSHITPMVMEEITKRCLKSSELIFVEVPLLFECNYQDLFDQAWVITRPVSDRIESVISRSNLSKEQIIERINKQVDYDKMDLSPYVVINNDGEYERLKEQILQKLKEL